jgi:hypothetical protein
LVSPTAKLPLALVGDRLVASNGELSATIVDGIASFPVSNNDDSIDFYERIGGPRFHERAAIPYSMSALDTDIYHRYLSELRGDNFDSLIVDVGGGDGRNTVPWLRWGFRRVIIVDPIRAALARFRTRVQTQRPEWLDRLLLIQGDARYLPLRDGCAGTVQAIEALCYLNEEYSTGLGECIRLLSNGALLLLADRDYEAGLLARLFYGGGIRGMLDQANSRDVWDGAGDDLVRSRCFTADELLALIQEHGLRVKSHRGTSIFSLILGYERSGGRLVLDNEANLSEVRTLLDHLGRTGTLRRCHVIVAERSI